MRLLLVLFALLYLGLPTPASAQAGEKVLNVYNWTDYIDPKALERFTNETGIAVRYDVYDSLETLEAKLLAGHSGYDVVVPTSEPTFSRLVKLGALRALDRASIPDLQNLDPAMMRLVATSDPGNAHGAIYLWGSTGLGMIPARISALAPDAPLDSWDVLFKPENARRIAPCGITMMDSAIDVIPTVLKYLGKDPNSTDPDDLAEVERTLMAIRPAIRTFASGGALEALAAGETCLVTGLFRRCGAGGGARDGGKARRGGALRRTERGRAACLRHAGCPGRRAASGQCRTVHQLPAAA